MDDAVYIPRVASLLADPARASILWILIDGTRRPAGELAFAANVSAQSASAHLAKLVEGGLLLCEAQGRHRYYKIASVEAASLIEGLASFGAVNQSRIPRKPSITRTMPAQFMHARTCYDHLAGTMAVDVMAAMLRANWLEEDWQGLAITPLGHLKLRQFGVDTSWPHNSRRPLARGCVDLTERRSHLAGVLGAALLDMYVREKWILRSSLSRIVTITPKGTAAFRNFLASTAST